jgi:hypothetical protein
MFPENSVFGKVAERLEFWRLAEKDDEKDDDDEKEKPKLIKKVEKEAVKKRKH